jgi:xanthine phosphoribosyltransferase
MAGIPYEDEIIISWVELHRDARYLAEVLHQKGPWKGIIAVTRGGLVPAALVARELDIRLVDTGKTARAVRQLLPKAYFACLYAKPAGRAIVDTFVKEFKQTKWIHFPWDIEYKFATPIKDGGRVAPGP